MEKPRILVVEDDPDVLRFLQVALEPRFELTLTATETESVHYHLWVVER